MVASAVGRLRRASGLIQSRTSSFVVETIIGLCDAAGEDRKEAFIACGYLRESDLGRSVLKESERQLLTHVRHLKPKTLESLTEIAQALRLRDEGKA